MLLVVGLQRPAAAFGYQHMRALSGVVIPRESKKPELRAAAFMRLE